MEIRAAVAEDDAAYRAQLVSHLRRFGRIHEVTVRITEYADGEALMREFRPCFDVFFLDIEMPLLDGMQTAKRIRERDESVTIIFITNMAQYAIRGYEVGALDFLLKPVSYSALEMRLTKVCRLAEGRKDSSLVLNLGTGIQKISVSELLYVELVNHDLIYHLKDSRYTLRGSMREAEESLKNQPFFKCNSCYLVNLDHVKAVSDGMALVDRDRLQISRARKKAFMEALASHLAGA